MSKSKNKSIYVVILLVVVAAGVVTVVSSFASTPNEGAQLGDQAENTTSLFSQKAKDALLNQ